MSDHLDRIIAEVVAEHPLPDSPDGLDDSSHRYLERQAARAGLTPEAFYSLSRSRSRLSEEERFRAQMRDRSTEREAHERIAAEVSNLIGV